MRIIWIIGMKSVRAKVNCFSSWGRKLGAMGDGGQVPFLFPMQFFKHKKRTRLIRSGLDDCSSMIPILYISSFATIPTGTVVHFILYSYRRKIEKLTKRTFSSIL